MMASAETEVTYEDGESSQDNNAMASKCQFPSNGCTVSNGHCGESDSPHHRAGMYTVHRGSHFGQSLGSSAL